MSCGREDAYLFVDADAAALLRNHAAPRGYLVRMGRPTNFVDAVWRIKHKEDRRAWLMTYMITVRCTESGRVSCDILLGMIEALKSTPNKKGYHS